MSEEDCRRLLRRCFTLEEWGCLVAEKTFQEELAGLRKAEQIERLIAFGLHLLSRSQRGVIADGREVPEDPGSFPGRSSPASDRN